MGFTLIESSLPWYLELSLCMVSLVSVCFFSILFLATRRRLSRPRRQLAWDKYFFLLNVVTAVAIALSLPAVLSAINIWRRAGMRRITKVKYSVAAFACSILCWFALHWHLLGPVRI
jgi:hypothetical protein